MRQIRYCIYSLLAVYAFCGCKEEEIPPTATSSTEELPDWYYAGGELGTAYLSTSNAYEQPTPVVEADGEMNRRFKNGEALFEHMYMSNHSGVRSGLGPAYVRSSCIHCHPGYGHGKRNPDGFFETSSIGNGCLLVVYNPDNDQYVSWLTGMPQGHATEPFKAPLDETKVIITWQKYTDEWNNRFPDGETYDLEYPEVTMSPDAVYAYNRGVVTDLGNYDVLLESTIGIYGTGLLDAISDEDLKAQYAKEERDGFLPNGINPAFFQNGEWVKQYSNTKATDVAPGFDAAGEQHPFRFTYALSRGPLQDAAGANAMWNIPNVTRSNRRYHYLDTYFANAEGDDNCYDPNGFFARGDNRLPRYPRQTIWPYSDLIQHKLHMKNDIRTGWCRTTPLWGRGLHQMCTGAVTADRLHDNRARNVIEAIMWHGSPQSDARWSVEAFRNLPKADRDAIVKFIDSI